MVIHAESTFPDDACMDNKAVRARNIEHLVRTHMGPTAFGRLVDRDQVQVSQWLGGKPIGDRLARHIEDSLAKPTGWLDQPHWEDDSGTLIEGSHAARLDPQTIVDTIWAILVVLRRRDKTATLDLTQLDDAQLFAEVYAEADAMPDTPDGGLTLGALVADLVQAREAKRSERTTGEAGGIDRGKAGRKSARG